MNIGIVHPSFPRRGGAENLTVWLAAGLAGRGHEVTLFAAGFALEEWEEVDLSAVRPVQLPDRHGDFWHEPTRSRLHGEIIADNSHGAGLMIGGIHPSHLWLSAALARMNPRPPSIVYSQEPFRKYYLPWTDRLTIDYLTAGRMTLPFHDRLAVWARSRQRRARFGKGPWFRRRDRRALRRIDRILGNSQFTAQNASRVWRRPVQVCYPGVPLPAPVPPVDPARRAGVLVLTGWEMHKNPMGVLGTIHETVHRLGRRDIHFTLVGRKMRSEEEAYLLEHDLQDAVTLKAFLSEEAKLEALRHARLCLYIPHAEPFGLVPVEAMLCETPVIASRSGGPAEVVTDGVTGRLVDPYDPRRIARELVALYDDDETRAAMGAAGRQDAETRFALDVFLDRFEAFLPGSGRRRDSAN